TTRRRRLQTARAIQIHGHVSLGRLLRCRCIVPFNVFLFAVALWPMAKSQGQRSRDRARTRVRLGVKGVSHGGGPPPPRAPRPPPPPAPPAAGAAAPPPHPAPAA